MLPCLPLHICTVPNSTYIRYVITFLSETIYSMLTDCGREREFRLGWQEKIHVCWFDGVADVAFPSFWTNFYFSFEMSRDEMAM